MSLPRLPRFIRLDELNTDLDCVRAGKFRELQRLTVQYARVLGITHEQDADGGDEDGDPMAMEGA